MFKYVTKQEFLFWKFYMETKNLIICTTIKMKTSCEQLNCNFQNVPDLSEFKEKGTYLSKENEKSLKHQSNDSIFCAMNSLKKEKYRSWTCLADNQPKLLNHPLWVFVYTRYLDFCNMSSKFFICKHRKLLNGVLVVLLSFTLDWEVAIAITKPFVIIHVKAFEWKALGNILPINTANKFRG